MFNRIFKQKEPVLFNNLTIHMVNGKLISEVTDKELNSIPDLLLSQGSFDATLTVRSSHGWSLRFDMTGNLQLLQGEEVDIDNHNVVERKEDKGFILRIMTLLNDGNIVELRELV